MTSRDRRTVLVGAGVVAALFTASRGIPAAIAWNRSQLDASARVQRDAVASVVDTAVLRAAGDTLAARRVRLAVADSTILQAESPAAASARLASMVEGLADSCRLRVSTIQLRGDSTMSAGVLETTVRLNATTDVAGLAAFLHAVDGAASPMVVRDLAISATDPAAPASRPEALRVDLLVAALVRLPASGRR